MNNPPPLPQHQTPLDETQPYVAPDGTFDDGPKSKNWSGCLIGCLAAFGICTVLCAGVGFYVYSNATDWIITGTRATAEALLQDSGLPLDERNAIIEQFDRVAEAYKSGNITLEEMGEMLEELAESPAISLVMIQAVEAKYLNSSGLSDEEKDQAKRTLMRVVRAAQEEKLAKEEIDRLSQHILTEVDDSKPEGQQQQLRTTLTDEELREFFAEAKEIVDTKEIPDEDYDFEIADILKDVVDKTLADE